MLKEEESYTLFWRELVCYQILEACLIAKEGFDTRVMTLYIQRKSTLINMAESRNYEPHMIEKGQFFGISATIF